jgi:uncharacterized protein (DUF302 family)
MKKSLVVLFFGFVLGVIATGFFMYRAMPGLMLNVRKSRLGFEETVVAVSTSAIERGWRVPKIYDLQTSLVVDNYEDMTRMKIVSLYGTDDVYRMVFRDDAKMAAALLPWRIAVYETADGSVYISRLNTGILSRFYRGSIGEVMSRADREEQFILEHICH